MNRRLQQWIGVYLVLCLMGAGVVGLSPWLHHWLEHGGVGVPHVHVIQAVRAGAGSSASSGHDELHRRGVRHSHGHDHGHDRDGVGGVEVGVSQLRWFRHDTTWGIDWGKIQRFLTSWCNEGDGNSSGSDGVHEHHGLVEAMLGGGVDLAADGGFDRLTWTGITLLAVSRTAFSFSAVWFSPTAGRGPPVV